MLPEIVLKALFNSSRPVPRLMKLLTVVASKAGSRALTTDPETIVVPGPSMVKIRPTLSLAEVIAIAGEAVPPASVSRLPVGRALPKARLLLLWESVELIVSELEPVTAIGLPIWRRTLLSTRASLSERSSAPQSWTLLFDIVTVPRPRALSAPSK